MEGSVVWGRENPACLGSILALPLGRYLTVSK